MMQRTAWVPAYWKITYAAGYGNGQLPYVINEYVGAIAAIEVLSNLAAMFARFTSASLGIDGMSQGVSMPGPNLYALRIQELMERRKKLCSQIRAYYDVAIFSDNV